MGPEEIEALTASIDVKTARSGELAVKHAEMMNDLDDEAEVEAGEMMNDLL